MGTGCGRDRRTRRGKRSAPPKPHKHRRARMNARTAAVRTPTLCAARPRTVRVAAGKNRNTKRKTTERRATDDAGDDNGQGEIFKTENPEHAGRRRGGRSAKEVSPREPVTLQSLVLSSWC